MADIPSSSVESCCGSTCSYRLKMEMLQIQLNEYKQKYISLRNENSELKRSNVIMQARAETEEEFITNSLLKKIHNLKKEKEALAKNCEKEEEFLTNTLNRQCTQLRNEKIELEKTIENQQVNKIEKMEKTISKLEHEMFLKQTSINRQKIERGELENALENEQESLVNRLWKQLDQLETDKRILQHQLDNKMLINPMQFEHDNEEILQEEVNILEASKGDSCGTTNLEISSVLHHLAKDEGEASNPKYHIKVLKHQISLLIKKVKTLSNDLANSRYQNEKIMMKYEKENSKLQRKLNCECLRNEQLYRQLSESESSIDLDEDTRMKLRESPITRSSLSTTHKPYNTQSLRMRSNSSLATTSCTMPKVKHNVLSPSSTFVPISTTYPEFKHSLSINIDNPQGENTNPVKAVILEPKKDIEFTHP
ncbi:Coiled-coil domain-containing protein 6 [Intoshia linei]|uniref:Coiled-coil domain-containing protein 6 n=1 Tax=Intoshia linei TaxID=1819745 RepID=A0A177B104_9BILA|nr:Coiled-coil domain-containing protein 6 [Intoshia linei]